MPSKNFSYTHIPTRTSSLPSSPSSPTSTANFHSSTDPSTAPSTTSHQKKQNRATNPHFSTYVPGPISPVTVIYANIFELSGEPAQAGEHPILHRTTSGRLTRQKVGEVRPRENVYVPGSAVSAEKSHSNGNNADSEYSSTSNSGNSSSSGSSSDSNTKARPVTPEMQSKFSDYDSSPAVPPPTQLRQARAVSIKDFRRASIVTVGRNRRSRGSKVTEEEGEVRCGAQEGGNDTDGDVWSELAEEEERMSRSSKGSVRPKGKGGIMIGR